MGIQKLKELRADATVCGQTREIYWNEDEGSFLIEGVASFPAAMEVLAALGRGGVAEMPDLAPPDVTMMTDEMFRAYAREHYGFEPPPAPDPAAETAASRRSPEEVAADVKAAAQEAVVKTAPPENPGRAPEPSKSVQKRMAAQTEEKPAPKEDAKGASSKTTPPGTTSVASTGNTAPELSASEDLSVFGTHTKLSEAVEEIRKRGHNTYESILAYCKRLQDLGDVSPPIDQYGAKLEERLKVHLSGKGIAVPA